MWTHLLMIIDDVMRIATFQPRRKDNRRGD